MKARLREGFYTYTLKIHRHGSAFGITIPLEAMRELEWEVDDAIHLRMLDDGIVLVPVRTRHKSKYRHRTDRFVRDRQTMKQVLDEAAATQRKRMADKSEAQAAREYLHWLEENGNESGGEGGEGGDE